MWTKTFLILCLYLQKLVLKQIELQKNQKRFYDEVFFPYLKENNTFAVEITPEFRDKILKGKAFFKLAEGGLVDEADPLRRLGFVGGGPVKKNEGETEEYDVKKVIDNKVASLVGISQENLDWAKNLSDKYSGGLDGKGDAARHLGLGYITSLTKNPSLALKAANARELIDPIGGKMDVFNNNLGSKIKAKDLKEAEAIIDNYIKNKTAMFMTQTESEQARGY